MKKLLWCICVICVTNPGYSKNLSIDPDPTIFQISDVEIKESEIILETHLANDGKFQLSSSQVIDLVIMRKQLALEALHQQFDTAKRFKANYANFVRQKNGLAKFRSEIATRLQIQAFQRSHYLIKASHILIAFPESATKSEIDRTRLKAKNLRQEIMDDKEQSFESIALEYSDAPGVLENRGEMDYFTVFEQIYPLESAAFETKVGSVSQPVKSRFGFHLLKVDSRDKMLGKKRLSQIMIRSPLSENLGDQARAKHRINEIRKLTETKIFSDLVRQFSEDFKSKQKGGDLGTDRLINTLESARTTLALGEVSQPIQSRLGWHILKVTELKSFPRYNEVENQLKQKVTLDSRVDRVLKSADTRFQHYTVLSELYASYKEQMLCAYLLNTLFSIQTSCSLIDLFHINDKNGSAIDVLDLGKKFPVKTVLPFFYSG